jgi:hypothetical protein
MKRIRSYNQFRESRPIKEEFIGKMLRNLTGKNAKRIDLIKRYLMVDSRVSELRELVNTLPGILDKEVFITNFKNRWNRLVELKRLPTSVEYLFKTLFDIKIGDKMDEEINKIGKISDYDSTEWERCELELPRLKLPDVANVFNQIKLESLTKYSEELKSNKESLKSLDSSISSSINSSVLYWGDFLDSKCAYEYRDTSSQDFISPFVKSLCLKLDNQFFYEYNYTLSSLEYDSLSDNYIKQYGVDFVKKFDQFLDKKVIELPEFISIENCLNDISKKLEERDNKIKEQNLKVDKFRKILEDDKSSRLDMISETWNLSIAENKSFKLEKELKNPDNQRSVTYLNLYKVIDGFKWLKSKISDKTVKEITEDSKFGDKGFGNQKTIIVQESDSKSLKYEDGKTYCGNVFYIGVIFPDLTIEQMSDYINKRGRFRETHSGKALYCTTHASAAAQYAWLRTDQTKEFLKLDQYAPTVYKLIIKPGSKFLELYKGDTSIEPSEIEQLKRLGLIGLHSGNNEVMGGNTQETTIIDPNCIDKIEKMSISELEAISDVDWRSGSKSDKSRILNGIKEWNKPYETAQKMKNS